MSTGPKPVQRKELSTASLTWNTVQSLPLSELQDLEHTTAEHTKVEHKGKKAGIECWATQHDPTGLVLGMDQSLALEHQSGGLQFANT